MYARLSFLHTAPSRLTELVDYVRGTVQPALRAIPGSYGIGMWTDTASGDAMVMGVWADEKALSSSEQAVGQLRNNAAALAGGTATVERYEVALVVPGEPHQIGYAMRLVRMTSDPAQRDAHIQWTRDYVIPQLEELDGFISYVVGVDETGRVAAMTTFRTRAQADATTPTAERIWQTAAGRGINITDVNTYEVALVGIDVPTPALPRQQGSIDLREAESVTHRGVERK